MAKAIKRYGQAECIEVAPVSEEVRLVRWGKWRKKYIGMTGHLSLCEYEQKQAGKQFLCFEGGDLRDLSYWCLDTSPGNLVEDGGKIIFTTKNTRYVFELRTE